MPPIITRLAGTRDRSISPRRMSPRPGSSGLGLRLVSAADPERCGSQVSYAHPDGYAIVQALIAGGVIPDFRAPDVRRFGFAPLYVRHVDVFDAVMAPREVLAARAYDHPRFRDRARVT